MKPLFNTFIAAIFVASSLLVSAQNSSEHDHFNCGKNYFTEAFFQLHPEEKAAAEQAAYELENFTRDFVETTEQRGNVFVIPVVFHIIHANGVENISNAQIENAIEVLNENYSANTPGIQNVVSQFQSIIANVGFEFRLARKDPNGNCTNGIVRTYSQATFDGGENLKTISPIWPRQRYLNIWVCNTIEGNTLAYTFIPSDVNGLFGATIDGIVTQHNVVGSIGTSNTTNSFTLAHEVGHWCNLEHTWGTSNTPGLASNCNMDDGVADTPNTVGWQSCNLNGTSCGSLDNTENFMDYSFCSKMFTTGQSTRMRAALMSPIAQRNQLHTESNLTFTGVNQPEVICVANFEATSSPVICIGQTLTFSDLSFNGVTNYSWSFPGGTPSTSTQPAPTITYNSPGLHNVSLTVSNGSGSLPVTKQQYVTVLNPGENSLPYFETFENFTSLDPNDENWFVENQTGTVKWVLSTTAGYTGSKSVYVRGRDNTDNEIEILDGPTYDLSGISDNAVLRFKYAHARRTTQSADRLRIWISRNCGELWSLRRTINMADLPTVSNNVTGQFTPASQNDWAEVEISNIVSVFLNPEFRVRFEFLSYRGNNLYIDDINIFDPATVSVSEIPSMSGLNVFPNPSTGIASVSFGLDESALVAIDVLDISGRQVAEVFSGMMSSGEYLEQLNLVHLKGGVYLLRIQAKGGVVVRKLVINP